MWCNINTDKPVSPIRPEVINKLYLHINGSKERLMTYLMGDLVKRRINKAAKWFELQKQAWIFYFSLMLCYNYVND